MFMGALDAHIVNVALPTLSREFHSTLASVQWTVVAYVLALAIWIPASGWIGDRFGTKRTFLLALSIFTASSALCGQAHSLGELVAFRALQGTGGGMLTPVATSMLFRAYPPAMRSRLMRILILPILVAPAAAPLLGGLFVEHLSWRWVFYANVPFGLAALVFSSLYIVEHRQSPEGALDIPGFVLSGAGLSLVLFAISEGSLKSWTAPSVLFGGTGGILALALFVRYELRHASNPILRLVLLKDRIFRATNIVSTASTSCFMGILFLTPVFLQEARGQSPVSSGLTTFVEAFGVIASTQTIGRLYSRHGPRRIAALGMMGLALSTASLAAVGPGTNIWIIRIIMFIAGFANSTAFLPVQTAMFSTIQSRDTGHAAAIFNANRQSSLALGVAILTTIVSNVSGSRYTAFHAAFLAAGFIALCGSAFAWSLIHDSDARATMISKNDSIS
jgi:EmrB/QacA subfamily drug resistance transporter